MYVKPVKAAAQIPDPVRGGFLPVEGAIVDDNDIYWQRRIGDGDVVEITKPAKSKTD